MLKDWLSGALMEHPMVQCLMKIRSTAPLTADEPRRDSCHRCPDSCPGWIDNIAGLKDLRRR
jgi:hypothetical protein